MGELLQINIGKKGNDIGTQYLQKLIQDHRLLDNKEQLFNQCNINNIKISFQEFKEKEFFMRGIFDFCDQLQAKISNSYEGRFINPDFILPKMIINNNDAFHNSQQNFQRFQKDLFVEKLRINMEDCENKIEFNLVHSSFDYSAGGALEAIKCIKDEYPANILTTFSIFPNLLCTNTIEIYNSIFSIQSLITSSDQTLTYDYQALQKVVQRQFKQDSFSNYHNIISETLLQLTCPQRFNGYINGSMRKLATNMIPYPRFHFLTSSFLKLETYENLEDQISNLSQPKNSYFTIQKNLDYDQNYYLTQSLLTRSKDQNLLFQEATKKFSNVELIDNLFYNVNCSREHPELGTTLMHVGNQKHFGQNLKQYQQLFIAQYRRKSFIHHYTQQGADEMEFIEAENSLNDFICEYYDWSSNYNEYDDYEEELFY